jgi:hypothetical protein
MSYCRPNYRTESDSASFKRQSGDNIAIEISVDLRIRSANVGEGMDREGMYAYDSTLNKIGWRPGSSSRTGICNTFKGSKKSRRAEESAG